MKRKSPTSQFLRSTGRRVGFRSSSYPQVTRRDIECMNPKSVFCSLLTNTNWISRLDISTQAKRLTRLQGRQFKLAVEALLI